jgi:diadenosine tetraphosphate (Ap4A) HIT family hydrolase
MMNDARVNEKLLEDCYLLGRFDDSILLLMRNALFPWFVLVPQTNEFIEDHYRVDKINIASIGNVVTQMHVHVIGRTKDDVCWPGVVWGTREFKPYEADQIEQIKEKLAEAFQGVLYMQDDKK